MRIMLVNPPHPSIGSRIPVEHLPPLGLLMLGGPFKHQVLEGRWLPPWRVLLWIKLIEAVMQLRPRSLRRLFRHPEPAQRAAMRWYYRIGRQVWPYELWQFLFRDRRRKGGPLLSEFMGDTQEDEAEVMDPTVFNFGIPVEPKEMVEPTRHSY